MATTADEYIRSRPWAEYLTDDEFQALKGQRYLLRRPDNVTFNWTVVLAARSDMKEIDGLQNMEIHKTNGIASLGIFAGKDGKVGNNPNSEEDGLFFKTDQERMELEAEQAEKYAQELRQRASDADELRKLDEVRETIVGRPDPPDYGSLSKPQLVIWARDHCGLKIKMPMNKPEIVGLIEAKINEMG